MAETAESNRHENQPRQDAENGAYYELLKELIHKAGQPDAQLEPGEITSQLQMIVDALQAECGPEIAASFKNRADSED